MAAARIGNGSYEFLLGSRGQHRGVRLGEVSEAVGEEGATGQSGTAHNSRTIQPSGSLDNSSRSLIRLVWEWSRKPTGRTAGELEELCNLLRSISFDFNRQVSWNWSLASNSIFAVKTLSKLIDLEIPSPPNIVPVIAAIRHPLTGRVVSPKKLEVFVWRVLKKRLPIRIELDKRGIDLHSVRCPVCDNDLESVHHALFECKLSSDVWARVFKWWNSNININSCDLLRGKYPLNMSPFGSKIWQAVEWTCAYSIWRNRNSLVFQGKSSISPVILNEIQVKSFDWISARIKGVTIDWHS
ncbi:uncharacterized protein [Rutidosis leptorrhynchoides]|uniref:uncharacterized protein n=1 Tax=Rutidosis leptorrhynchoides TaxID=125765 RepID=UPI003A998F20